MRDDGSWDRTGVVAAVIAVLALVGMVVAVPSLLPRPLQDVLGLGPHRLGEPPTVTGPGRYAFLEHQPGAPEEPVTYDPCKPVKVKVNPAGGPDDAVEMAVEVMAEVSRATGLRLEYDGTTEDRPQWSSDGQTPTFFGSLRVRPSLVSWATADEVPALAGKVAGIGGSVIVKGPGNGPLRYVTGSVTLDADLSARLARESEGHAEERAIMLHEFGHLVGLDHVDDPRQLMYPEQLGVLDFAVGDRKGLTLLGQGPCA